jgi:hypothetical protein
MTRIKKTPDSFLINTETLCKFGSGYSSSEHGINACFSEGDYITLKNICLSLTLFLFWRKNTPKRH